MAKEELRGLAGIGNPDSQFLMLNFNSGISGLGRDEHDHKQMDACGYDFEDECH